MVTMIEESKRKQLLTMFEFSHINATKDLSNEKFICFMDALKNRVNTFFDNESSYSYFKVIEEYDNVLGCAGLIPQSPDLVEFSTLAVSPDVQGRGLGRTLLESAIEEAKNQGFSKMFLWTYEHMKFAIALYKKYGFVEETPPCEDDLQELNPIYMVKDLNGE